MKKAIVLLIAVGILLNGLVFGGVFANDEPSVEDSLEFGLLAAIQVLPEGFGTGQYVKRGEFASIIVKILYPDLDYSAALTGKPFVDVSESNLYYNEIKALKDLNIALGENGMFYPNANIKTVDGIALLIKALGYQAVAEAKGGYPSGYSSVANQIGMLRGLSLSETELSPKSAAKLIYNSLLVNLMSDNIVQNGQTVLSSVLGIAEYDAVIVNNGISSPQNEGAPGEKEIVISDFSSKENILLKTSDLSLHLFLGCRMKLFAKENRETGEREVIYKRLSDQVRQTVLTGDKILRAEANYVEYETDKDSATLKKLQFSTEYPFVFINGVSTPNYTPNELRPDNGFVTFIDNNSDNRIDFIKVTNFDYSILIDRISEEGDMLYCSQNPSNSLDLSDETQSYYRVIKNGEIADLKTIEMQNVISVAKSQIPLGGKILYELYVGEIAVTGSVTEVTGDNELIIEGVTYPASTEFLDANPNFFKTAAFGYTGTIRLNALGQIAFADKMVISDVPYCYLINISEGNGISDEIQVKYYSFEGMFKTSILSPNVKIDGRGLDGRMIDGTNAANSFAEARELLCVRPDETIDIPAASDCAFYNKTYTYINPRPAIVKANGKNEIISIDTDAPTYEGGTLVSEGDSVLTAGRRVQRDARLWTTTYNGGYLITQNTVVLKVADVDRYGLDTGAFSHLYINAFEQNISDINNYGIFRASPYLTVLNNYDMQAYNVDSRTGVAGLVVLRGDQLPINSPGITSVFLRMSEYYDPVRDKQSYKIYYYQSGEEQSAAVDLDYLHPWYKNLIFGGRYPKTISFPGTLHEVAEYETVEPLRQGDIINVEKTGQYVTFIGRELKISSINEKIPSTYKPGAPTSPYAYNAYSATSVGIPFDERNQKLTSYNGSYNMELGIPLSISEDSMCVRIMYNDTAVVSTIQDYIASGGAIDYFDRYIPIRNVPVTVVEEISCNGTGGCEFMVRMGDFSDIKFAQSDSAEDINNASRLYYNNKRGVLTEMVIFNLKNIHNQREVH